MEVVIVQYLEYKIAMNILSNVPKAQGSYFVSSIVYETLKAPVIHPLRSEMGMPYSTGAKITLQSEKRFSPPSTAVT